VVANSEQHDREIAQLNTVLKKQRQQIHWLKMELEERRLGANIQSSVESATSSREINQVIIAQHNSAEYKVPDTTLKLH
jgi:hypothetical protein